MSARLLEEAITEGHSLRALLERPDEENDADVPSEFAFWQSKVAGILQRVYGAESMEMTRWRTFKDEFARFTKVVSNAGYWSLARTHVQRTTALLIELRYSLIDDVADQSPGSRERIINEPKVFIIHGHDITNTLRLKDLLQNRFGLHPVVLMDEPGGGRTIIQKFEEEAANCRFAFALLTPDDQVSTEGGEHTQARPNVVFELGWFYARLGREGVVIMLKKGTQIHSDLAGIERYEFAADIREQALKIEDELIHAGLIASREAAKR